MACGPRAYSPHPIREYLHRQQIAHTIPEKRDQAGHRLQHGSARERHTRPQIRGYGRANQRQTALTVPLII
jgi:hypothetical protein